MHLTAPSNWSRSIGTGGRDPSERVVTIAGMLEGSNRSRVTGPRPSLARDLFEAGLNEAASWLKGLWAFDPGRPILGEVLKPAEFGAIVDAAMLD
jgi:hypothetical protein